MASDQREEYSERWDIASLGKRGVWMSNVVSWRDTAVEFASLVSREREGERERRVAGRRREKGSAEEPGVVNGYHSVCTGRVAVCVGKLWCWAQRTVSFTQCFTISAYVRLYIAQCVYDLDVQPRDFAIGKRIAVEDTVLRVAVFKQCFKHCAVFPAMRCGFLGFG